MSSVKNKGCVVIVVGEFVMIKSNLWSDSLVVLLISSKEIKRIVFKFTKTVILLGLVRYELILSYPAYGLVGYIFQLISGVSSKNNC